MKRPTSSIGSERAARGAGGFTLLELLVCLSILALLTAAAPSFFKTREPGPEEVAREMAAAFREARAEAIRAARPVRVAFDLERRRYGREGRERALPETIELRVEAAREARRADGDPAILFFADGSATGGVARLRRGAETAEISVRWLTGAVRLAR